MRERIKDFLLIWGYYTLWSIVIVVCIIVVISIIYAVALLGSQASPWYFLLLLPLLTLFITLADNNY